MTQFSLIAFAAFLASNLVLVVTGSQVRCPDCSQRVLLNSWVRPHPEARRARVIGYKAIVLDVLQRSEFVCYHCGQTIRVKRLRFNRNRQFERLRELKD